MASDLKFEGKFASYDAKEVFKYFKDVSDITKKKSIEKISKTLTAVVVFPDIIDHFQKEMGPDGQWKSWGRAYTRRMIEEGKGGNKMLQDTGNLRQSFKPGGTSGTRVEKDSIVWFNNATTSDGFPYAWWHDSQEASASRKSGPRKFMWLSNKALKKSSMILLDFAKDPKRFK